MGEISTSIMTIDDLAVYLKISKSTLYKLAHQGSIPGQKVGRHWRFRKETIDRWLDDAGGPDLLVGVEREDTFENGHTKGNRI
ncbi:MAG: helix-turn-helix domain-containing protein [Armatimonadota bacterium]